MKMGQKNYENNKKVICINLMKGNFRKTNENLINRYLPTNQVNHKILDEGETEIVLIRLDLCDKVNYNLNEERFVKWLKLINAKNFEELENIAKGEKIMEQSIEFLKRFCVDNMDHGLNDIIETREFEAYEQGGKETLLETAKNFLAEGVSIKTIMKATGLSKKQVEALKNKHS